MTLRAVVASFDAIAMVALAFTLTGGSFADARASVVVWGSAAAAVTAAIVVLGSGPASVGWVAIGYILGVAFVGEPPFVPSILLAVAYMPVLERPRGSLLAGLGLAATTAAIVRYAAARAL